MDEPVTTLIARWKDDPHGTYRSWFLWEERLKNFRSIRRGIGAVVREIEAGIFGNAPRGSSLETGVGSIAFKYVLQRRTCCRTQSQRQSPRWTSP